jgi:hypothetical protein
MTGRRGAQGVSLLCALALGAVIASSAIAAPTGYTAFTCAKVGVGGKFKAPHCKSSDAGPGEWSHKKITEKIEITTTNVSTAAETTAAAPVKLTAGIGSEIVFQCAKVQGEGTLENKIEGEEMYVEIRGQLHYTECLVIKPVGVGCKVKEGTFITNELTGTTKGQGMDLNIAPTTGTAFVSVTVEGCKILEPLSPVPFVGSFKVRELEASGATFTTTHADVTSQNTFKAFGQKAALESSLTIKSKAASTPISFTTPPYSE